MRASESSVAPMSKRTSASGGALFAGAAAVMQAEPGEILILYHTDLRGRWPEAGAAALARRLPYARRTSRPSAGGHASLAGIALALRALADVLGRSVAVEELRFPRGGRPRLAAGADEEATFSVSHSGPWVGCAVLRGARVGLDIEMGTDRRIADWVTREALVKAGGEGLRALPEVRPLALRRGSARWRGVRWHLRRLTCFAGASACVMTSRPVREVTDRAVALEELFAP